MLFDILTVLVVTLISSLLVRTTSVHGLPTSTSTHHHHHHHHPSAHSSSSLRPVHQHPVPSVDYDLGGDPSEMLIGESNEFPATNNHDHDLSSSSSSSSMTSSIDAANIPFDFYLHQMPSKLLSRKLLLSLQNHQQHKEAKQQQPQKRGPSRSISAPPSLPTEFNPNSVVAAATFADPSDPNSVVSLSQLSESTRLSPSLKALVEKNPIARAWLTMLLQKVMEEQPAPYIFKYGRRRK